MYLPYVQIEAFVRGLKMEERGLVGEKVGTRGTSAKEAKSGVGKSSAKERSVEGVVKRKEEEGGGLKAEKEKKKEKHKTNTVGKEGEGDMDGGGAAPPTDKGTKNQQSKDRKTNTKAKRVKGEEKVVEGKRSTKDTPNSEVIGEQLLLLEAQPHKKLLMDLNTADPWSDQVRAACI